MCELPLLVGGFYFFLYLVEDSALFWEERAQSLFPLITTLASQGGALQMRAQSAGSILERRGVVAGSRNTHCKDQTLQEFGAPR